jgi:hypothetical protein
MLAQRDFSELGIRVIAHKDYENGKAYRSIELLGIGVKSDDEVVAHLANRYAKSLSKVYISVEDFANSLAQGKVQVLLIPDIQYGDATVLQKFEAVCAFLDKAQKKVNAA